ncbi:major facilitator superfamily [Longilinea arvoryzae]|uniref:Major facilitator superfamily n=1 Tax=Longilinea arvoryzae TaxID=360412 RepID=A0A0S7BL24_9CHLR|nr:MFS transporter [Longilinea arvoryzae]GAP14914.1 major facilitator superfamily [Longilinea arvoryzae]
MMELETAAQSTDRANSERVIKRNFLLAVINGVFYIFAEALIDPTLVLVGFVSQLTQNPILMGLVLPIRDAFWALPQLWVSGFLQNRPLKIRAYRETSIVRISAWCMLALSMNLNLGRNWMLIAFFISFSIASLASGFGSLPFLEVVSKTIPPQRRGELFAWRFGVSGLLGIGGSFLVRWLVSDRGPFQFPHNYGTLAFAYFVLASVSLLIFNQVQEQPDENILPRRNAMKQFRIALAVLKTNVNYRRLVITIALMILSTMAIPFFAIYVEEEFQVDPQWIGTYLGVLMVSNLLSNIFFGRLSRKTDNQKVIRLAASAGGAMILLMLLLALFGKNLKITPTLAALWLVPVFFLAGVRGTGFGISSSSLLLNIAQPEERSLMIGFTQFLLGLVILSTSISGVLIKTLGFIPLVVITLITQISAWSVANRLHDRTDR